MILESQLNRPAVAKAAASFLVVLSTSRPPGYGPAGWLGRPVLRGLLKLSRPTAILGGFFGLIMLGASAYAQSSVTLAWDPDPDNSVAGYRLYEGVLSRTYTNVIDTGNATIATVSNLVWGTTYYFAVTAYDTNGQESALSDEISFTVPLPTNTPPTIALTSPTDGASFAAPASISLAASVTANGHTVAKVQFYNGTNLLAESTDAPYGFVWTNVGEGSYSLSAMAVYDSDSSVSATPVNVTVTNVTLPSIALTSPTDGASFEAPACISLDASVSANGHTIASVQFYNGTNLLADCAAAPYSFVWTNIAEGSYSLSALAVYDSGNTAVCTPVNVTVRNVPLPTVALTSPADGACFGASVSICLDASVTANGHCIAKVQFYNGTNLLADCAAAPYSFVWTNIGEGSYSLSALAAYDSGSTAVCTPVNVTITNVPLPTIALTSPADGASSAAPASILLDASVTANGHGIATVQFYNGTNLLADCTAAPYSFIWTNGDVGTYTLSARAVYDSGSTVSSTVANVTVTAKKAPLLGIYKVPGATSDSSATNEPCSQVILSATAGDPGQSYSVQSSPDLTDWTAIGALTLDAAGCCYFTNSPPPDGSNCFYRLQIQ
jgi:hypothetical protein